MSPSRKKDPVQAAVALLAAADPVLGEIIARVGPYAVQYREPDFETLVRSIVFQQLSGRSARAIFDRLKATLSTGGRLAPEAVTGLDADTARRIGLSGQKLRYLHDLSCKVQSGALDLKALPEISDAAVIEQLTAVTGIGTWTAQMYLLFALRRPDVLATGDLGIRTAIRQAYGMRALPKPARVERLGAKWRPYRSIACWYLWRSLEPTILL
jgi:DNA-3-methyladenine glycosylase II